MQIKESQHLATADIAKTNEADLEAKIVGEDQTHSAKNHTAALQVHMVTNVDTETSYKFNNRRELGSGRNSVTTALEQHHGPRSQFATRDIDGPLPIVESNITSVLSKQPEKQVSAVV